MSGQYFRQNLRQMIIHIIPYLARFFKGFSSFLVIFFVGQLLKVTSTYLTEVEISLKRIFMVELSVRRLKMF